MVKWPDSMEFKRLSDNSKMASSGNKTPDSLCFFCSFLRTI